VQSNVDVVNALQSIIYVFPVVIPCPAGVHVKLVNTVGTAVANNLNEKYCPATGVGVAIVQLVTVVVSFLMLPIFGSIVTVLVATQAVSATAAELNDLAVTASPKTTEPPLDLYQSGLNSQ